MRIRAAFAIVALFVPVPLIAEERPGPTPQIKVEHRKGTDFTKYKVFAWAAPDEAPTNAADHLRLTKGLEAALVGKGLAKAESGAAADLYLRYSSRIEKKRPVSSGPAQSPWNNTPNQGWKVAVDVSKVDVGTMGIELLDGQSKVVIWQSKAEARVWGPDPMGELIQAILQKVAVEYPPNGG